jgi:hypothetical protein
MSVGNVVFDERAQNQIYRQIYLSSSSVNLQMVIILTDHLTDLEMLAGIIF